MKKIAKVVLVNVIIFTLFLLVLEVVLRIVDYGPGTQPMDADPVYHHVHPKDYSFTPYDPLYDEYSGHFVHYDSFGKRVRDRSIVNEATREIWFIGDSYTEAIQVPYDSSFVGRFQNHVGDSIHCVNYGNASYSPLIHTIILQNELEVRSPECVYIQVYSNDLYDDDKYAKQTTFKNGLPVSCNGGDPNSWISVIRKSYLARNLRRIYWTIKYANFEREDELTFRHHVEHSPNIEEGSLFVNHVLAIDSILDSRSIPHYFFAIPSKYACYSGDWKGDSFDKIFNNFANRSNLPFIDVRSSFEILDFPSSSFFYRDIHLTAGGNEILASSLIEHSSKK